MVKVLPTQQELERNPPQVNDHPKWSYSAYEQAQKCMKAYWFGHVLKYNGYPIPVSIARGKLLHHAIEKFFKLDESGLLVPKNKSEDAFANSVAGSWQFNYATPGEMHGQKIIWDFEGQQFSKDLKEGIKDSCRKIYRRYTQEPPRLRAEFTMEGIVEGIHVMAIADELRQNLVIRDHKSGYRRHGEFHLNHGLQMTNYLLCLFNCLQNRTPAVQQIPEYQSYLGIDNLVEFLEIASVEIHDISGRAGLTNEEMRLLKQKQQGRVISQKDFLAQLKEIQEKKSVEQALAMTPVYRHKRTVADVETWVSGLKRAEDSLCRRDFHPTIDHHCDDCFFKQVCASYDPAKVHSHEKDKDYNLFTLAGIDFKDRARPEPTKPKEKQATFRLKC